jgi:dephospho-CoA kinase
MELERFIIQEGLYDPGIFKAFFLAGGPGSGKTYVNQRITPGLGLKNVNSDTAFENALKKAGLSLDMPPSEEEKRDIVRARAKKLTTNQLSMYIRNKLGLVIDSTARDYVKMEVAKAALTRNGYESWCIFVNTSLDVALARNAARDRTVPTDIVKKSHAEIQQNMGKLQRLFGMKNFIVIDNNKANEKILDKVYKMVRKIVKKPVTDPRAKMWMRKELERKQKMSEDINIPIKVGDVVKGGKFKNKSIKVKKIGKNEKGDITINDKPLLKVRIPNENN